MRVSGASAGWHGCALVQVRTRPMGDDLVAYSNFESRLRGRGTGRARGHLPAELGVLVPRKVAKFQVKIRSPLPSPLAFGGYRGRRRCVRLYRFHPNNRSSKCEVAHTSFPQAWQSRRKGTKTEGKTVTRFAFAIIAVTLVLIVALLAVRAQEVTLPPIYQPQLLLVY